jgi:hypothetical protein
VFARPQRVRHIQDRLLTSCANVVLPHRMPLPPLEESYSLSDDSIAYPPRTPHQLVMQRYIRTLPTCRFRGR